ncbi:MAG: hypothetical protein ACI9XR_002353, partial [Flavobacterium sp.]
MKQKLKLWNVFCYLSLLMLFGCTEERDYIEKNNLQNIKFSTISFDKLLIEKSFKKTNERILIEKQKTAGGRSSIENYYNFDFVEGSDANIIEIDNRKYYNVLIRRSLENPDYTENLLILVENINNVEEISAFIIKYNLSNESSLNDLTDIDKEITPLFARTIMYCYNVCTTFCYNTIENSPKYSEPHYPGSDCTNSSFIATTCSPECKEITIGVLGDSSYTPPFENPFSGSGTTAGSDQTTIVTTPQNQNGSTQNTNQLILAPVLDDVEDEPTVTKTPCEHLNDLMTVTSVQTEIQTLKPLSNGLDEHGFFVKNGIHNVNGTSVSGSYTETIPSNPKDPHHLSLDGPNGLKTGKVITAVHCHTSPSLNGGTRMFSPGDVSMLHSIAGYHVNLKSQKDFAAYSVLLVTSFGTF